MAAARENFLADLGYELVEFRRVHVGLWKPLAYVGGSGSLAYFRSICVILATRPACRPPPKGVVSQTRSTSSAWVRVRSRPPSVSTLESLCSLLLRAEALS